MPGPRMELLAERVREWRRELFDLGGRNPLLFYKNLKAGTLDLAGADPQERERLISQGGTTRLGKLYPDPEARKDAARRAKTIRRRIREFHEERGVQVGYLAVGSVTWTDPSGKEPNAPVFLRETTLTPLSASGDDFTVEVDTDVVVNPALRYVLDREFGVSLDTDEIKGGGESNREHGYALLSRRAAAVPGLAVTDRAVLGTFSFTKLPMVNDLDTAGELLGTSDLIAALAGDTAALAAIRPSRTDPEPNLDAIEAKSEFLVLDADSSQTQVINAVAAGGSLVVEGPPGTGKSQTIANLLTTLMAKGQRVLFVAEKRAAVDAVVKRLSSVGLDELVMDVHGGASDKRRLAADLGRALDKAGNTLPGSDLVASHLDKSRTVLGAHHRLVGTPLAPWGLSPFEVQSHLIGLRDIPEFTIAHLDMSAVRALAAPERVAEVSDEVAEYAELAGRDLPPNLAWRPEALTDPAQVTEVLTRVGQLRAQGLPELCTAVAAFADEARLPVPDGLLACQAAFEQIDEVRNLLTAVRAEVWDAPLPELITSTATRKERKSTGVQLSFTGRRRHRKQATALAVVPLRKPELYKRLRQAAALSAQWAGAKPSVPSGVEQVVLRHRDVYATLDAMARYLLNAGYASHGFAEVDAWLREVAAQGDVAAMIARRNQLRRTLTSAGLGTFLTVLDREPTARADSVRWFQKYWYGSILTVIKISRPAYQSISAEKLDRNVAAFQRGDDEHLANNPARIRRLVADRLYRTMDAHLEQQVLIKRQASLSRRHLSLRKLIEQGADVLFALKPCWVMSPLVVSELLPAARLFDVVIFDEASQVPVADAIPSIMRGKRLVVTGDTRQLPPTAFFGRGATDEDDDEDDASTAGYESVLHAYTPLLHSRTLRWHYRSRDERLIAFSNAAFYDRSLVTFPGAEPDGCVSHVHVDAMPAPGMEKSVKEEVDEVVRLVLDHARKRPDESIGVIAMSLVHAERIDMALTIARDSHPELAEFLSEKAEEPFFVKNLERVQGDERDAVILSLGYGRRANGGMSYNFGPVNRQGGERRLNVAVTRARNRMTVVSSFTADDLDPDRLHSEGPRVLREYLEYASSGGTRLGARLDAVPALNPFEIDVRDRLTAAGIPLIAQYGVAGYRIDFAAKHPQRPGRMVLAIEADGASYHSSPSARERDRLRQAQLERLGWRFHRIWSTSWFNDPDTEIAKVRMAYERAVADSDAVEALTRSSSIPAPAVSKLVEDPARQRVGPRPPISRRQTITDYTQRELVRLVRWWESDGRLRTVEELVRELTAELGFKKVGSRIRTALEAAVIVARRR